jgi:hypothetical protein
VKDSGDEVSFKPERASLGDSLFYQIAFSRYIPDGFLRGLGVFNLHNHSRHFLPLSEKREEFVIEVVDLFPEFRECGVWIV